MNGSSPRVVDFDGVDDRPIGCGGGLLERRRRRRLRHHDIGRRDGRVRDRAVDDVTGVDRDADRCAVDLGGRPTADHRARPASDAERAGSVLLGEDVDTRRRGARRGKGAGRREVDRAVVGDSHHARGRSAEHDRPCAGAAVGVLVDVDHRRHRRVRDRARHGLMGEDREHVVGRGDLRRRAVVVGRLRAPVVDAQDAVEDSIARRGRRSTPPTRCNRRPSRSRWQRVVDDGIAHRAALWHHEHRVGIVQRDSRRGGDGHRELPVAGDRCGDLLLDDQPAADVEVEPDRLPIVPQRRVRRCCPCVKRHARTRTTRQLVRRHVIARSGRDRAR